MCRFLFLLIMPLLIGQTAHAQLYSTQYRVPGQNWMELNTDRFRIIYPERYYDEAVRSLAILEQEYADIQDRVGGELRNFPIIINPENDRSNGFVSPLNFRSEIELSPIIGKTMNPASGSWLEMVLPHELVHALHFNVNPNSISRLAGILSPDIRRSVHSAAPMGVFEGIAVQYESDHHIPSSGRGHYPYFTNQFDAVLNTPEEWSMGQLLIRSEYSLPFDRHYIGGYEFSNWLLGEFGDQTVKRAIRFHYKYPFLGYGTALRHATGNWPRSLYRQFSGDMKEQEEIRKEQFEKEPFAAQDPSDIPGTCRRLSRPKWISNSQIVYYGRFCNRTTGFYLYDLQTKKDRLIQPVSITPDHIYDLSENGEEILFSRYHTDALYDNVFQGDLHRFHMESGRQERLTENKRLYAPHQAGNRIYAMQPEGSRMRLVSIHPDQPGEIRVFKQTGESSAVEIAIHPGDESRAAIIGKVKSVQGIWFENMTVDPVLFSSPPDIVFKNGSVFDIQWESDGESVLFASDQNGALNIYRYSFRNRRVERLTNSMYNVMEPHYSPDKSRIAYIGQTESEQLLYVQDAQALLAVPLADTKWVPDEETENRLNRPLMNRPEQTPEYSVSEYKTGWSWLKPRAWVPGLDRNAGRNEYSIRFESADVMSTRLYSASFKYYADRPWYDITFDYKGFYPGFRAELYNEPTFTAFTFESEEGDELNQVLLQQSRGVAVKVPVRIQLKSNVRFSSLLFEPQYFLNQVRYFDEISTLQARSEFGTRHTIGFRSVFNLGLRQFVRDMQPNSGVVFYTEGRLGLNSDSIHIDTDEVTLRGSLTRRKGIRAGVIGYAAPLSRWNQSLRVSGEVFSQTPVPVFGVLSRFSELFDDYPVVGANNIAIIDTRYTIPLTYPDQGGLLVPLYLSNIYMVLFSQTAANLDQPDWLSHSRTVVGTGIRSRFKFGNIHLDIGISVGWEPGRNQFSYYFGSF